jgi:hypothetical protein
MPPISHSLIFSGNDAVVQGDADLLCYWHTTLEQSASVAPSAQSAFVETLP